MAKNVANRVALTARVARRRLLSSVKTLSGVMATESGKCGRTGAIRT